MSAVLAQALQSALIAASHDAAHRSWAVTTLRGANLWAATWPTDPATLRTLTNSDGVTALAVFSDEKQLEEAAVRYGWLGVDGRVPSKRLHLAEALRFAKQHHAQMVVVDITSDHALELTGAEMELASALPSTPPSPYTGMPQVQSSSRPPSMSPGLYMSSRPPAAGQRASARPTSYSSRPTSHTPSTPSSMAEGPDGPSAAADAFTLGITGLETAPSEDLLDALTHVLKDYPEVEWASLVRHIEAEGEAAVLCVALRIEPQFRKNLSEMSALLRGASAAHGSACEVLLLETPEQMKQARQVGKPFYPWRKK